MIRISIIHPNASARHAMAQTLSKEEDMRIIHQISTANEALVRIGRDTCHVILASALLPNDDAMLLLRKFKSQNCCARVVITDLPNDNKEIMRHVTAGALGYTLKQDDGSTAIRAIRAVKQGQAFISDDIAAILMRQIAQLSLLSRERAPKPLAHTGLTAREQDILELLAKGHSNKIIADRLIISIGTVKNHVHNVLKKLNLRSRKEVVRYLSHINGGELFGRGQYAEQMV